MKKLVLLILPLFIFQAKGQVLKNVNFDYNEANRVFEIQYYYSPYKDDQATEIWLELSTNGGSTFEKVKSVTGDVGVIQGRGTKKIYWSVFEDYEELDGYIMFRVAGKATKTMGQAIASTFNDLIFGSSSVRDYNESVQFYYGIDNFKYSENGVQTSFEKKFDMKSGSIYGMKIISYPIIWDFYLFKSSIELKKNVLPILTEEREGAITGWGGSLSYTLLPIFKYIQPYLGFGYKNGAIYIGKNAKDAIERKDITSMYVNLGIQLSLAEWLKFNFTHMKSTSKEASKNWYFTNYNIAIKF